MICYSDLAPTKRGVSPELQVLSRQSRRELAVEGGVQGHAPVYLPDHYRQEEGSETGRHGLGTGLRGFHRTTTQREVDSCSSGLCRLVPQTEGRVRADGLLLDSG